jgi:hypothetical protein
LEEVQNIESDEEDNASEESRHDSLAGGGGDEMNPEEGGEEGEKKDKGEVTPPKDPPTNGLKQEKEEVLEKLRVAQKEKNEIWAKFEQNNAKIQEEKDQLAHRADCGQRSGD